MSRYTVEYVESLRFERVNDDGTKTVFSVEEPKSIGLTSPRSILTGKYGVQIGGVNHHWNEVFHHNTRIIIVGKIVEIKSDGYIKITHEGEFDFEELCEGKLVKVNECG